MVESYNKNYSTVDQRVQDVILAGPVVIDWGTYTLMDEAKAVVDQGK